VKDLELDVGGRRRLEMAPRIRRWTSADDDPSGLTMPHASSRKAMVTSDESGQEHEELTSWPTSAPLDIAELILDPSLHRHDRLGSATISFPCSGGSLV